MTSREFGSLDEFWPFYLSQHLHPTCRALHLVGTSLSIGLVGASLLAPPLLLAVPVVGYSFAWTGHFVFEGNRPATFGHPVWSFLCDLKMLGAFLRGHLAAELDRARRLYPEAVQELVATPGRS